MTWMLYTMASKRYLGASYLTTDGLNGCAECEAHLVEVLQFAKHAHSGAHSKDLAKNWRSRYIQCLRDAYRPR